jgi:hypothetical protein
MKILWLDDEQESSSKIQKVIKTMKENSIEFKFINERIMFYTKRNYSKYDIIISDNVLRKENYTGLDLFENLLLKNYKGYFIIYSGGSNRDKSQELFKEELHPFHLYYWINKTDNPQNIIDFILTLKAKKFHQKKFNKKFLLQKIRKIKGFELNYESLFESEYPHNPDCYSKDELNKIIKWCSKRFNVDYLQDDIPANVENLSATLTELKSRKQIEKIILINKLYSEDFNDKKNPQKIITDLFYEVIPFRNWESFLETYNRRRVDFNFKTIIVSDAQPPKTLSTQLNENLPILLWSQESANNLINENFTVESRIELDKMIQKKLTTD